MNEGEWYALAKSCLWSVKFLTFPNHLSAIKILKKMIFRLYLWYFWKLIDGTSLVYGIWFANNHNSEMPSSLVSFCWIVRNIVSGFIALFRPDFKVLILRCAIYYMHLFPRPTIFTAPCYNQLHYSTYLSRIFSNPWGCSFQNLLC